MTPKRAANWCLASAAVAIGVLLGITQVPVRVHAVNGSFGPSGGGGGGSTSITGTGLWHNTSGALDSAAVHGSANQLEISTGSDFVPTTVSGDSTNVLGVWTNGGLKAHSLPSLPGSTQNLQYTGSAWQFAAPTTWKCQFYTSSQAITANAAWYLACGCGGGGGGAGSEPGTLSGGTNVVDTGGAGAGNPHTCHGLNTTIGNTLQINLGAGGTGGAISNPGHVGTLTAVYDTTSNNGVSWPGGAGGDRANLGATTTTSGLGGSPGASRQANPSTYWFPCSGLGCGGSGFNNAWYQALVAGLVSAPTDSQTRGADNTCFDSNAASNVAVALGGNIGTTGTTITNAGGGGGAGGGAGGGICSSTGTSGGTGGAGGNGAGVGGTATAGSVGVAAGANTCAGGGSAGSGGNAGSGGTVGAGNTGGAGGSGVVLLCDEE